MRAEKIPRRPVRDPMGTPSGKGTTTTTVGGIHTTGATRTHWPDDAVRKRDGESKHNALLQMEDEGDEEGPVEEADAFFEGWSSNEIACYQDAKEEEQKTWIQLQGAKRTLREARARQHEAKMSRKFYKTSTPAGAGRSFSSKFDREKGPCFLCGERGHVKAECPHRGEAKFADREGDGEEAAHLTFHSVLVTEDNIFEDGEIEEDDTHEDHLGANYFTEEDQDKESGLEPEISS